MNNREESIWETSGAPLNSLDCWDYTIELECLQGPEDLQLAAELGKTLLERNKELENTLRQHQHVIDDQTQEIEYLTKQTVALREVNDSRLRIYEQLEVSIQDLERANHRLALDNSADKKHVKSLCHNLDTLESKCEELQRSLDDSNRQLQAYRRREERPPGEDHHHEGAKSIRLRGTDINASDITLEDNEEMVCDSSTVCDSQSFAFKTPVRMQESKSNDSILGVEVEEITSLLEELRESRSQNARSQRRVAELEEQLSSMVQEHRSLQDMLNGGPVAMATGHMEDMKSMHEEFSILDEVRQGQLCGRCLRSVDNRPEDTSSLLDAEEDPDDRSLMDSLLGHQDSTSPPSSVPKQTHRTSVTLDIQESPKPAVTLDCSVDNPYRDLVEKYEALLEVQRLPARAFHRVSAPPCLSLQEELQMSGDFSSFNTKDTDDDSCQGDKLSSQITAKNIKHRKTFSHTPTDFSEAETSSSGFSDETSNKSTQTEERTGSFLCTIADGEDCKFSIYDVASPIDSRFRNRPEYRELFKEIFTVLKKAAENKDEGEKLPLLDDETEKVNHTICNVVTDDAVSISEFTDDTRSILSSVASEQSVPATDRLVAPEPVVMPSIVADTNEVKLSEVKPVHVKPEPVLTPYKRQPLEYLSVGVNIRKKNSSKRNSRRITADRAESPVVVPSPIKVLYRNTGSSGKKRKDLRPVESPSTNNLEWNGSSLQFYNRSVPSPTPSQNSSFEYRPSTASQDLIKLKKLDLSYAEVLRKADTAKNKVRRK